MISSYVRISAPTPRSLISLSTPTSFHHHMLTTHFISLALYLPTFIQSHHLTSAPILISRPSTHLPSRHVSRPQHHHTCKEDMEELLRLS
ncbi:hypothetical protein Pmani_015124 [Petrolisthes manimaculis]|uniref:Uncharacterized protein n=1 Tax=Petrolisthes manimaculis TaxID=1843537 RepID=A0AAE1PV34_9EUCA|nr:hypothetical protein Pmani_015124 [Petrolisthes manimaculis]